ncbi:DUF5995 family protein [Dietzia sp.]|uniref:DUF5995 family protein n=1 Tax=Dietzia sp. TaxID=1871616 RepID=UPI002FDA8270
MRRTPRPTLPHHSAHRAALVAAALAVISATSFSTAGLPTAAADPAAGLPAGSFAGSAAASVTAGSALPEPAPLPEGTAPSAACGTPLSGEELGRIAELSARPVGQADAAPTLADFEQRAAASAQITDILVAHDDRRAIFGLGLDLVEKEAVLPLYEESAAHPEDPARPIPNLPWALTLSSHLLDGYLDAMHAHATGGAVAPHWQHYFEVAADCSLPGGYAAMAGYNAHLTVDLARAVSTSGTTPAEYGQYLEIVGAIADHGDAMVALTSEHFEANLAPLWRLYFLGEAADGSVGAAAGAGSTGISPGEGHRLLLRTADQGYSTLSFGNGLLLADPATEAAGQSAIGSTWAAADQSLQALSTHGFL